MLNKQLCFVFGDGLVEIRFLLAAIAAFGKFYFAIATTAKTYITGFIAYGKRIGPHGGKALGKLLIHGLDGGDNTHQRHNPECNNGHSKAGAQFICTHGTPGQHKNITKLHYVPKLAKVSGTQIFCG